MTGMELEPFSAFPSSRGGSREGRVPCPEFLRQVYESALDVSLDFSRNTNLSESKALLTLLTYCYARGLLSSEQIEASAAADRAIRYICAGRFPTAARIRSFRRGNKTAVIRALSNLLVRMHADEGLVPREASREAARRVDRAVYLDSIESDV